MATLRLIPASGSPIEVGRDSVVGREPSCEVAVNDGSVSRKHARLEQRGGVWTVVDQGSANGTFLDSQRVAESALRHGQELRFGAVAFKIEIPGEEDFGATVANVPVLADEATVMRVAPVVAAPERPAPPPLPKPLASPPPPLPTRPTPSAPPPPPSAAAAKERFRSPASPSGSAAVSQGPAGGDGARPPRKGRGPFFWIGTGCCGCLVLVALLIGLFAGGIFYMTKGAVDAVHAELGLIKRGEVAGAYGGLSQSLQAEMSQQDFEQLIASHPGLRDNTDSTFFNRSVQNDTATLSGALTSASGPPEPVTFKLVKEGGAWKVSEIRFTLE